MCSNLCMTDNQHPDLMHEWHKLAVCEHELNMHLLTELCFSGGAQVSESFQSLNKDKAGIHNLITSATGKSSTDAVSQKVESLESFSSSNSMPSNRSDMTYASLRDPFPDGHSETDDGISLPSKSSERLDASNTPNSLPRGKSGPTFLGDKIRVYPHSTNMTLPKGTIVLPISDDEWVAAKLEFPY